MKNKKLLTAATSVALVAVVGVGATLAYFTDNDSTTNTVTMGHVDINLTETTNANEGEEPTAIDPDAGMQFTNVMPGDVLSKILRITVQPGSQNAYIRVQMDIEAADEDITAEDLQLLEAMLREQIVSGDWYFDGEYYYYANEMEAADSVDFFRTVNIPAEWGNNTADGSFTIDLVAEAIQAENVTPDRNSIGKITGWPEAVIEEYTGQ